MSFKSRRQQRKVMMEMRKSAGPSQVRLPEGIHPDVVAAIRAEGDRVLNVETYYSDLYVETADWATAHRIRNAGKWRSMASTFTSNITGRPNVDIPFAFLSGYVEARKKGRAA